MRRIFKSCNQGVGQHRGREVHGTVNIRKELEPHHDSIEYVQWEGTERPVNLMELMGNRIPNSVELIRIFKARRVVCGWIIRQFRDYEQMNEIRAGAVHTATVAGIQTIVALFTRISDIVSTESRRTGADSYRIASGAVECRRGSRTRCRRAGTRRTPCTGSQPVTSFHTEITITAEVQ